MNQIIPLEAPPAEERLAALKQEFREYVDRAVERLIREGRISEEDENCLRVDVDLANCSFIIQTLAMIDDENVLLDMLSDPTCPPENRVKILQRLRELLQR